MTDIIIIIACLIGSAFFSASETALSCASKVRLKSKADAGSKGAARTLKIIDRYDKAITTILIGNNIVNILLSSVATILCINLVGEAYGSLVATVATTVIVLIFGEVLPKSIAKDFAVPISIFVSGIISFLMLVFTPVSFLFSGLKKLVAKLLKSDNSVTYTEDELKAIVSDGASEGVLEKTESTLVKRALEFDDKPVSDILVHRTKVIFAREDMAYSVVEAIFNQTEYSRLPVTGTTVDDILGFIHEKEFRRADKENFNIRMLLHKPLTVPTDTKLNVLFEQMQKERVHLAVVCDEYGGVDGIVTMEDIIEAVMGDIWDETDGDETT